MINKYLPILIINLLIFMVFNSANGKNVSLKSGTYNYLYTYISIDSKTSEAKIFQYDFYELVALDTTYRGIFKIKHIKDRFYSLEAKLPGLECIEDIILSSNKDSSLHENTCRVNFKLGDINKIKGSYLIMAKRMSDGTLFQMEYGVDSYMTLEGNITEYEFAILSQYDLRDLPFTLTGYNNTIKFLKLPTFDSVNLVGNNIFQISLPLFRDEMFFELCINGKIIEIKDKYILYNGNKYELIKCSTN